MNAIQFITGLLMAGESAALFIGMHLRDTGWNNPVNRAYVLFDIIVGGLLTAAAYDVARISTIVLATSALTHIIRDYDYMRDVPDRYAFNIPLLIVLNIRLLGLLLVLGTP